MDLLEQNATCPYKNFLEEESFFLERALRRLKLHFPQYGDGYLYLVLRSYSFDYCEAIAALKNESELPVQFSQISQSTSLKEVLSVVESTVSKKDKSNVTCMYPPTFSEPQDVPSGSKSKNNYAGVNLLRRSKNSNSVTLSPKTPSYPQRYSTSSDEQGSPLTQRTRRGRRYRHPGLTESPLAVENDRRSLGLTTVPGADTPCDTGFTKEPDTFFLRLSEASVGCQSYSPVSSEKSFHSASENSSRLLKTEFNLNATSFEGVKPPDVSPSRQYGKQRNCFPNVSETEISVLNLPLSKHSPTVKVAESQDCCVPETKQPSTSLWSSDEDEEHNAGHSICSSDVNHSATVGVSDDAQSVPIPIASYATPPSCSEDLKSRSEVSSVQSFHDVLSVDGKEPCTTATEVISDTCPPSVKDPNPESFLPLRYPTGRQAESLSMATLPRHIHEGRRHIVLLGDETDGGFTTLETSTKTVFATTNEQRLATGFKVNGVRNTDALSESVDAKNSKGMKQRVVNQQADETGNPRTTTSAREEAAVVSTVAIPITEPTLLFPYSAALDGYLLREKELSRLNPDAESPVKSEPSPAPEVCGFKWWPKKRRFYRSSLGSTYLCPRHRFLLSPNVYNALYDYQKLSVAWMFELFKERRGGILADEMGLGKTVQATVFLRGLFSSRLATHALVLLPLTLINQWKSHLMKWCPDAMVCVYHGSKHERQMARDMCFGAAPGSCAVLLTTYETFRTSCKDLSRVEFGALEPHERAESCLIQEAARETETETEDTKLDDEERIWRQRMATEISKNDALGSRPWDVVIMDEAHKIKNPSNKSAQTARLIYAHCRILMTGTPVANSLDELWSLMDCAQPSLLGTHRTFKREFADPIKLASARAASDAAVARKNRLIVELQQLVTPYFLRRTVAETLKQRPSSLPSTPSEQMTTPVSNCSAQTRYTSGSLQESLPPKTDVAVWIRLTASQKIIYEAFLSSHYVKDIFKRSMNKQKGFNAMQAVSILLKLCRHPALLLPRELPLWWRKKNSHGRVEDLSQPDDLHHVSPSTAAELLTSFKSQPWFQHVLKLCLNTPEELRFCSGKLTFLFEALPSFLHHNHRCLIFSQSTQMLDIIQAAVMNPLELRYLRIDGSVPNDIRQQRIKTFQESPDIFALLMTTKVGGQGLNLTCADRAVIVDPDWTPANDNQAVARIHRLGQTKEVKVYRLYTAGGIEDHAFRLQTFKQGLSKVVLDCAYQKTYFSESDMKKIFTLRSDGVSETMEILDAVDPQGQQERDTFESSVRTDLGEDCYATLMENLLIGLSDYNVLYRELSGGFPTNNDSDRVQQDTSRQNSRRKDGKTVSRHGYIGKT